MRVGRTSFRAQRIGLLEPSSRRFLREGDDLRPHRRDQPHESCSRLKRYSKCATDHSRRLPSNLMNCSLNLLDGNSLLMFSAGKMSRQSSRLLNFIVSSRWLIVHRFEGTDIPAAFLPFHHPKLGRPLTHYANITICCCCFCCRWSCRNSWVMTPD